MISRIFEGFAETILEVTFALIPLLIFFLVFQFIFLKLTRKKLFRIFIGIALSFIGLTLFLQGVHVGFFPAGELMGEKLGELNYNWVVIPVGFLLGS